MCLNKNENESSIKSEFSFENYEIEENQREMRRYYAFNNISEFKDNINSYNINPIILINLNTNPGTLVKEEIVVIPRRNNSTIGEKILETIRETNSEASISIKESKQENNSSKNNENIQSTKSEDN